MLCLQNHPTRPSHSSAPGVPALLHCTAAAAIASLPAGGSRPFFLRSSNWAAPSCHLPSLVSSRCDED